MLLTGCTEASSAPAATNAPAPAQRIISLNGTLTEILYELGYGKQLVGVDVTSTYPDAASQLPKLGHISQLNIEGLLQLAPDLVFVAADELQQAGLDPLRKAGIEIAAIELTPTLDNALGAARQLREYLGFPEERLAELASRLERDRAELRAVRSELAAEDAPRVLFLYARGAGRLLVAGEETDADRMIELAGGRNAVTTFADFAALTPEALVAAAPDVILMFTSGLASLDGIAGLSQIPGIAETPAYRNERVIAMDGHYLLSFGPRTAQAAADLARRLYPAEVL
jgi:iron complex transport system substrate-binding protein